jgi:hypothetical protein
MQFTDNAVVKIARDTKKDYGLMLGRTGTIKMKCMRKNGVDYYQVRIGRVPFIDVIEVAACDLDPATP